MKKVLLLFAALFFIATAPAQTNTVTLKLWVQCVGSGIGLVSTTNLEEGAVYTLEPKTLTGTIASAQPLYDALVGTDFRFTEGSLNEDIELAFIISNVDCNTATYLSGNLGALFFFHADFEVKVGGTVVVGDYNLSGDGALLRLKKTPAFTTFFSNTGINPTAVLTFAYATANGYSTNGITTIETDSTIEASISHFSTVVGGENTILSVDQIGNLIPSAFKLSQNYPNPFNPSTKIAFSLPERADIELNVYNVLGVKVATLINEIKEAGNYEASFEANNLPSGLYLYELKAGKYSQTRKMLLVK